MSSISHAMLSNFTYSVSNPVTTPVYLASNVIAIGHSLGSNLSVYRTSNGNFGTKYSDPASTPQSAVYSIGFSPSYDAMVCGLEYTGTLAAYQWNSNTGFGTRYSNPISSVSQAEGVNFSPDGSVVFFTYGASPYVYAYACS